MQGKLILIVNFGFAVFLMVQFSKPKDTKKSYETRTQLLFLMQHMHVFFTAVLAEHCLKTCSIDMGL